MKNFSKIITTLSLLSLGTPAFAATVCQPDVPCISGIADVVDKVTGLIFPVAGLICVVFIIIAGYMWITSAGDPSKVKQAQSTLTWAIIGLVFVLVAVAIVNIVMNFVTE